MKTKLEIINETIEFYGSDPSSRATLSNGRCVYETIDGRQCAVGRCANVDERLKNFDGTVQDIVRKYGSGTLNAMLKPEYRGHSEGFWRCVQRFHDANENFTRIGLSVQGVIAAKRLRTMWSK